MTNPAEKILQVVEDTAAIIYDKLDAFENLAAAEEMTKYVSRQMLDVIIEEMEEEKLSIQKSMQDIRPKGRKLEGTIQINTLAKQLYWLKEARTSLTNTNDS